MVLPDEDDHTEVGGDGVKDIERTEHCRPGEEGVGRVADELDGQQEATNRQGNEKEEDLKWSDVDEG